MVSNAVQIPPETERAITSLVDRFVHHPGRQPSEVQPGIYFQRLAHFWRTNGHLPDDAYAVTLAQNVRIDETRKRTRTRSNGERLIGLGADVSFVSLDHNDGNNRIADKLQAPEPQSPPPPASMIANLLDSIPITHRIVVETIVMKGLPRSSAAEELGLSEWKIGGILRSALVRLREIIEREWPEMTALHEDSRHVLTPRQVEILKLIAAGYSSAKIALTLGLSVRTVDGHRTQMFQRSGTHKSTTLVRWAIEQGIIAAKISS